jgi:hypothetical protein
MIKKRQKQKKFFNISALQNHGPNCLNSDDARMAKDVNYGGDRRMRFSSFCEGSSCRNSDNFNDFFGSEGKSYRISDWVFLVDTLVNDKKFMEDFLCENPYCTEESAEYVIEFVVRLEANKPGVLSVWTEKEIIVLAKELGKILEKDKFSLDDIKKILSAKTDDSLQEPEDTYDTYDEDSLNVSEKNESKGNKKKKSKKGSPWTSDKVNSIRRKLHEKAKEFGGISPIDRALGGAMYTGGLLVNVDAAMQTGETFTTHAVPVQMDYNVTMSDDKNQSGAVHINTQDFGVGTYFRHRTINTNLYIKNRSKRLIEICRGDSEKELRYRAFEEMAAYIRVMAETNPKGKQTRYASFTMPDYFLVTFGSRNISLESAFEQAVTKDENGGYMKRSIQRLEDYWIRIKNAYGLDDDVAVFTTYPELSILGEHGVPVFTKFDDLMVWMEQRSEV